MIVRIWTVGIATGMATVLEKFANEVSLPMFRQLPGCLGVFFTRSEGMCATITLCDCDESIRALDSSSAYQSVVREIEQSGILAGGHTTMVYRTYAGFVDASTRELFGTRAETALRGMTHITEQCQA